MLVIFAVVKSSFGTMELSYARLAILLAPPALLALKQINVILALPLEVWWVGNVFAGTVIIRMPRSNAQAATILVKHVRTARNALPVIR